MFMSEQTTPSVSKSLPELMVDVQLAGELPLPADRMVTGIRLDSREVEPGMMFVALQGTQVDGHDYILDAVERGASAVVGTQPADRYTALPVPYLEVQDARQALADVSAAFYDHPARELTVIGVTGTDGKTTTANLIFHILQAAGHQAGMVSTVNAVIGDRVLDTGFHVTTPEAPDVQRYLRQMANAGLTHVILEATSHGLAQKRVGACEFDVGVVTNITHEHLDYHGSYEAYRDAKAELFRQVASSLRKSPRIPKAAVINADDRSYPYLRALILALGLTPLRYGLAPEADLWAENVENTTSGLAFDVVSPDVRARFETHLEGLYNVSNCLAAVAATVLGLGVDLEYAQAGVSALPGIPGRMERIELGQDFQVIVDFAHTPHALERALEAGRDLTSGQLIAVFGSAGLRDKAKRRMMAEISVQAADLTVLTAEDPRTEALEDILEEMAEGARSKGGVEEETFWRVLDRGAAIRFALSLAEEGDLVMVCGKGHEQSMCFGETEYPWDDRTATRAALAEYLDIPGPDMPYLPTQSQS
jgi:UDP-N-acetylmuramoyl-L-alanyl-D-glutamate--2,6-diaminopimelate ligase